MPTRARSLPSSWRRHPRVLPALAATVGGALLVASPGPAAADLLAMQRYPQAVSLGERPDLPEDTGGPVDLNALGPVSQALRSLIDELTARIALEQVEGLPGRHATTLGLTGLASLVDWVAMVAQTRRAVPSVACSRTPSGRRRRNRSSCCRRDRARRGRNRLPPARAS